MAGYRRISLVDYRPWRALDFDSARAWDDHPVMVRVDQRLKPLLRFEAKQTWHCFAVDDRSVVGGIFGCALYRRKRDVVLPSLLGTHRALADAADLHVVRAHSWRSSACGDGCGCHTPPPTASLQVVGGALVYKESFTGMSNHGVRKVCICSGITRLRTQFPPWEKEA